MKKINKKRVAFASLVIICLIIIIALIINLTILPLFNNSNGVTKNKQAKAKKESYDTVSLVAVGDNIIHERVFQYASTNGTYDFTPCYKHIKKYIQDIFKTVASVHTCHPLKSMDLNFNKIPWLQSWYLIKVLIQLFQKLVRGWGETPRSLILTNGGYVITIYQWYK